MSMTSPAFLKIRLSTWTTLQRKKALSPWSIVIKATAYFNACHVVVGLSPATASFGDYASIYTSIVIYGY